VTVTLPDRVLKLMEQVDSDRAKAIVKCVEATVGSPERGKPAVDLVEVFPGKALIVIGRCRAIEEIDWLRRVEIAPGRFLLILPPGMPPERLEVELGDIITDLPPDRDDERPLLDGLRKLMIQQRREKTVSKAELLVVDVKKGK
jgi:hypothetical protein